MAKDTDIKKEVDLDTVAEPEEILKQSEGKEINPNSLPDFVRCRLLGDCIYKGEIYPAGDANLPREAFAKGLKEGWARESQ